MSKNKGKKPKPKKLSAEEEAKMKANAVDDIDDDEYKKTIRKECRLLTQQIEKEENLGGLYQDERQRVNYFWIVAKKELEDKQAENRNKERELQDLKEKNEIETKIYKQRVKHLVFNNQDQLTELKKEAQITLKNVEDEHRIDERELKQDLRSLVVQSNEQEVRQIEYLNAMQKERNKQMTLKRHEHERVANEIQLQYKHKMLLLRQEMDARRKKEIERIEDKKNKAIEDLVKMIEKKYNDIKTYYQDITNTNLDVIQTLKTDLQETRREDTAKQRQRTDQEEQNKQVEGPLKEAEEEKQRLTIKQEKHKKIQEELITTQEHIARQTEILKDIGWQYEVRLQQFQYLQREKQQLFDSFHDHVYQIHQKTGLRNLIQEKKLETIQESLETKDAQINQLLAAAKIDPKTLGVIKNTLEEVENLKNESIKEIQVELKKIREAHSNMVKTYEGKLSEFGIPVEELGFDPLVPANI